VTEEKKEESLW